MRLGQFLAVWVGAIALVVVCITATLTRVDYHGVVAGTSLTDRAFPPSDPDLANAIGGSYVKHPHRGRKRHEIIRELKLAERAQAKVVFLEISHFVYRVNSDPREGSWLSDGWWPLRNFGHNALAETRVVGLETLSQLGYQRWTPRGRLDAPFKVSAETIKRFFPLRAERGREFDSLARAITDLKRAGSDIILVITPFSELAYEHTGEAVYQDILALAESLASQTDATLFAQPGPWPNTLYSDSFHLNRTGRETFRSLFVDWLTSDRSALHDG